MTCEPNWPVVRLEDVASDITVGHVGPMAAEYVPVGIPFLRSQNVEPFRISLDDVKYVGEDFHARLAKSALHPGDVVIVRTGRPGSAAVIPSDMPVANCADLVIVRPGQKLDARYLMYFINSAGSGHVASHLVGAVQQHFNVGSARSVCLPLPPLREQRRIARALGVLDDKIELNRRMSHTLESIARALFKSWFVDFDPVRKKMDGGDAGLPPDLAALFPRDFMTSGVGLIPQGWRVEPLDQIADFRNGLALQKFPPSGQNDLPAIKGAELTRGITGSTGRANRQVPSQYIVRRGDLLFSWSGSLRCVVWSGTEGALNQHVFKVTSEDFPAWFIFCWIQWHLPTFRDIAADKATTMGHIKRGHLSDAAVVVPSGAVLAAADGIMSPVLASRINADVESRRLEGIRNALLSRLIGGSCAP